MLSLPKNYKRRNPLRLVILISLAAFLFVTAAGQIHAIAVAMALL